MSFLCASSKAAYVFANVNLCCRSCEEGMGQSQNVLSSLGRAICLRCASKPPVTQSSPNPLPAKDWWKLAIEISEQNERSHHEEFNSLKRSVQMQLLTILKSAGEPFTCSKGQTLIKEGEINSTLYLIETGKCDVSVMLGAVRTAVGVEGGVSTSVAELSADDIIGEISFVLGCPASATVSISSEFVAIRKMEMTHCARLLESSGFKAKDLLKQIAFKLAEKLDLKSNAKLARLQLQQERQKRSTKSPIKEMALDQVDLTASIRLATYKRMFDDYDTNSSGAICTSECKNILRDCGIEYNSEVLEVMIERYDANGNGEIEFDEFMRLIDGISSEKAQVFYCFLNLS